MIALLGEYKDVFSWSYEDMKGLDPKFYQHQINLATDAKPVQQRRYRINPNYADTFPLPFTDSVLDVVVGHEMYNFLDGLRGYNQVRMHPDDQEKRTFVTEWGVFVAVVMMFGLKTAPTTFQRIISEILGEYIPAFM